MLYLFYGTDTIGVRQKAYSFVDAKSEKGFRTETIDADAYAPGILSDAAGGASLFGEQTLYVIDTPSADVAFYEDVTEHLDMLKDSENIFVVIEEALLAQEKKKFQKYAESIEEVKGEKVERFNTFALADALSRKDKKMLWLLLHDALSSKIAVEEIVGVLWWQLKSLRLAALTKSASEAGMKDFPYNKAKRSLSAFAPGEVEKLSRSLLAMYHDGHQGKVALDLALEAWTLRL